MGGPTGSANRGRFGFNEEPQPLEYYTQHRSVIIGSPDMVREQNDEYRAYAAINNIVSCFNFGGQPQEQVRTPMQLFADKVMPRFK